MKILICDDDKAFLDSLNSYVEAYMQNHGIACEIAATTDPMSAMGLGNVFDLAILDIQMEGIDGISLAKELKRRNGKVALFFVTNYEEYQDDAMDLRAFRYFSKPLDVSRLYSGLDKAMEYIDGAYVDVFLPDDRGYRRVVVDDIVYLTRECRKVTVHTREESFRISESYDDCCAKLPTLFFYPVHKSYFVNLHYVGRYSYSEIFLTDGTRIPVAPRKQAAFHKYWFEYLRRR